MPLYLIFIEALFTDNRIRVETGHILDIDFAHGLLLLFEDSDMLDLEGH